MAVDDLKRVPMIVGANVHCLASFGITWAFPDLLDPGELYPEVHLEWYIRTLDYPRDHAEACAGNFMGLDYAVHQDVCAVTLCRHGRIGVDRAHLRRGMHWVGADKDVAWTM